MLYLTSQRTKLSGVWCFEVFIINNDQCKKNGAKRLSGWRDMQINVPFPLESTHLGYRCTTCALRPVILYVRRLVLNLSTCLGSYKVSISLKLSWVQFDEVTCE